MPKAETGSTTSIDYVEFESIVHAKFGDERSLYEHMATYADSLRGDIPDYLLDNDDDIDDMDEFEREFKPKHEQPRKKAQKDLGKTALSSLSRFKSRVQTVYFGTMVTAVSKAPGTKSKQELLELDRAQKEKFASSDNDGLLARPIKWIRRNKYQIYSWAPVAAIGTLALERYAMLGAGYFGTFHPVEHLPFDALPGSSPLDAPDSAPAVGLPDANVPAPAPAPAPTSDIGPQPGPAPVPQPAPELAPQSAPAPASTPEAVPDSTPTPPVVHRHGPVWHAGHGGQGSGGRGHGGGNGGPGFTIYVGGNGDPTSQIPVDDALQQGRFNPNSTQVHYSASIAPLGPVAMEKSVEEAAQEIVRNYHEHRNDPCVTAEGFSLGAIGVDRAGDILAKENGGVLPANFHPITNGNADPGTEVGAFASPVIRLFQPMTDMFGINENFVTPTGTINRFDVKDFWGNGNQGMNIGADATRLFEIGTNHREPDPNEPHLTFMDGRGNIHEAYGDTAGFVPPPDFKPVPNGTKPLQGVRFNPDDTSSFSKWLAPPPQDPAPDGPPPADAPPPPPPPPLFPWLAPPPPPDPNLPPPPPAP